VRVATFRARAIPTCFEFGPACIPAWRELLPKKANLRIAEAPTKRAGAKYPLNPLNPLFIRFIAVER